MTPSLYFSKKISLVPCFIILLLIRSTTYAQNVTYSSLINESTFSAKTINVSLPVGSLAGSAGASGGATYSIPIAVPPGTNGIAPSLSVEYTSMGGNGMLGMGWSLSGMSAITRVARTVYHDGAAGPVELSTNDRFALDGARLISKTGTYGAAGSTYGTETETFATVTAIGTQGNGPVSFEVLAKDGTKMEFGNTTNSRFLSQTGNTVMVWRLNKVRYPDGNYIEYEYTDTSTERDSRIATIKYTGNDNPASPITPYNVIEFAYKIRQEGTFSDSRTTYEGGSSVLSKYLLDLITVKTEGTVVKKYQFDYGHDTVNSFLKSITEYGSDNTPLNPTLFKYGDTPVETTTVSTTIPGGNSIQAISGDYNGDGKREILAAHQAYTNDDIPYFDSFTVYKADATGTGYTQTASQALPTGYTIVNRQDIPNSKTFLPNDFTGDGLDDILTLNISWNGTESKLENVTIYESTNGGTFFVPHVRVVQPNYYRIPANKKFFYPGDFDGDGISEYIAILGNVLGTYEPFLCTNDIMGSCGSVSISGTTLFPTTSWSTADDINTLDFNGDGKTDLMLTNAYGCEIFTFQGTTAIRLYSGSFPLAGKTLFWGDFNGDGKTDLIQADPDFASVTKAISTGTDFVQSPLTLVQPGANDPTVVSHFDNIVVGDYNGDGKSDLYYKWDRTRNYPTPSGVDIELKYGTDLYYSQGDAFQYKQLTFHQEIQSGYGRPSIVTNIVDAPLDFNGDGKTDLVSSSGTYLSYTLFNKDGTNNLLQKVSNGFNHVTEWVYQNLTAGGSFYQRSVGTYPVNSIQPALYAVSEFRMQNGIGGTSTVQYSYSDARFHRAGKGFLGFTSVTANDLTTGFTTVTTNEFNPTFFAPAPKYTTTFKNAILSKTTLTNEWVDLGNKRFWYRVNSTQTENYLEGRTSTSNNTYDSYGNVTSSTANNNGVETTTTTTQFGQYSTPVPAKPTTTTTTKTRTGQPAYSATTAFDYNAIGQITQKTDFSGLPQQVVTTYGYNTFGNLTNTSVTPAGMTARTTSASYDPKGRFALSSTNVLNQTASATYDAKWGKPLTSTGIDGLTTSYQYDGWGRTTQTSLPEGYAITQSWGWDQTNGAVYYNQVQHPGKPDVKTWLDVLGREVKKQTEGFNGQPLTQSQTYDARGNVATSIQPYLSGETQLTTTTSYDDYNRVSSVNVTGMGTTSVGYSYAGGNLTTTTTNPAGQASSKVTDASGQTISATDNGGMLSYVYNSQGNLLSVAQGSTTPAVHEYDDYGRQTKLIDQNAGTTSYEYNAAGELTKQTNANGHVHNMLYDLMGRVTTRTGPEGTTTTEYYPAGTAAVNQVKKVTGFAGNVTDYTYDGYGRLSSSTETIDGTAYTTSYIYNTYGDVTKKTYPSGFFTNHAYDGNGYATAITNPSNDALFTAVTQNGLGQPLLYNLGNGKTASNTYEYGMPKRYYTPGVQDLNLTWTYASGNLQKRQDAIKNKEESFTYDNLNRLTGATVTGLTGQVINYSPSGNITSKTDAGTYAYLTTKPNAVSAVTNPTNVIPALQQLVSYTPFMQPQVLSENNYELSYTYGADYERIKGILKQNNALQRTRYYVGAGYEKDINAVSGVSRDIHYIDSPAGLIAIVVRENGSDTYHYVYSDHLGSILTVTDASGNVEVEQNFDAWGRRRNPTDWSYVGVPARPDWLYRGYTGHEHLDPFVLINMNGRLYDPVVGRVLSPDNFVQDPFSTQGFNRYSYGFNNPLKYTDPDGNFAFVPFLIAAGIGAISGYLSGKAHGAEGWELAAYTLGGAAIGGLSAGIGEAVLGAFSASAQSGMFASAIGAYGASGAAAGFVSGGGFSLLNGGDFWEGALKGAAIGGLTGALAGALKYNSFANSLRANANVTPDYMLAQIEVPIAPLYFGANLDAVTVVGQRLVSTVGPYGAFGVAAGVGWQVGTLIGDNVSGISAGIASLLVKLGVSKTDLYDPILLSKNKDNIWPDGYTADRSKIDWRLKDDDIAKEIYKTKPDAPWPPKKGPDTDWNAIKKTLQEWRNMAKGKGGKRWK